MVFLLGRDRLPSQSELFPGDAARPAPLPFPDYRGGATERESAPGQARGPAEAGKGRRTHTHSHTLTRTRMHIHTHTHTHAPKEEI